MGKTKEKAAKELKTKRCEVAGKSAKSENLNKKLEKSFKEAKELKKKLGETNKENEKKLEKKIKEGAKNLEKKSGEAKKKHESELASKEVVSDSAREKCYKGWEKHIKKEKALKEADVKRKLAEEKKCKAD